jgi:hypothetical protein
LFILFYAFFLLVPERGIAFSMLTNSAAFDFTGIAAEALRATARATGQELFAPMLQRAAVAQVPAAELESYAGYYCSPEGLIGLKPDGAGLKVNIGNRWFRGVLHADHTISLEMRILGIRIPIRELNSLTLRLVRFEGKPALGLGSLSASTLLAVKVESSPIPNAWKKRFGDYIVLIPFQKASTLRLGIDKETGLFMAWLNGQIRLPLRAVSDSECVIEGLGRNLGETIESAGDHLVYEGLAVEKKR